ncbi:hypothetical protein OAH34_01810 [bacterium]|nr:hypothetical protein [bacterium]
MVTIQGVTMVPDKKPVNRDHDRMISMQADPKRQIIVFQKPLSDSINGIHLGIRFGKRRSVGWVTSSLTIHAFSIAS